MEGVELQRATAPRRLPTVMQAGPGARGSGVEGSGSIPYTPARARRAPTKMISLTQIRRAIEGHDPVRQALPDPPVHRAAVAMILAGPPDDLSLCCIRRAQRAGDPWSGQMAFPGGRALERDPSLRAVAERETLEEVGLALHASHYLGELSEVRIRPRPAKGDGVLSAYLYYIGGETLGLRINKEVASAHWLPLRNLWSPENIGSYEFARDGVRTRHPGIRFGDQTIWGLTYRIITSFSLLIARPLPGEMRIEGESV